MAPHNGHVHHEKDNIGGAQHMGPVYLDDILITGIDNGDHMQNLHNVLARLQDAGLKLKREKSMFMVPSVEYLGHLISQAGLTPPPLPPQKLGLF
ncbi:hypothetical protein MRX96_020454 [Rhipicephalus microplus]